MKKRRLLLASAITAVGPLAFLSASCTNDDSGSNPGLGLGSGAKAVVETSLEVSNKGWTTVLPTENESLDRIKELKLESQFSKTANEKIYTQYFNTSYSEGSYPFDGSLYSGTLSGAISELTYGRLITYEYIGKPVYHSERVQTGPLKFEEVVKVLRPSIKKVSFELADQILLYVDGMWKTYDSDEIDHVKNDLNENTENGWKTSVVEGLSNNSRSVNSVEFQEDLKKATKMSFRIKPNQKWVDKNGNETKYDVVADDFRLSAIRTMIYQDASARRTNGVTYKTDKLISEQFTRSPETFTKEKPSSFNNKYLFTLFNISFDDILDRSKTIIEREDGSTYFTLNTISDDEEPHFLEYFDKFIEDSTFVAAPSQYIKENATNKDVYRVQSTQLNGNKAKLDEVLDTIANLPEGLTKESGIYWYGTSIDNTLFAGRYYTPGYFAGSYTTSYKINTHYHDQEWVNDDQTIKTFSEQYVQSEISPATWVNTISNYFLSGQSPSIRSNELNSDVKDTVGKLGYNFVETGNKNVLARNVWWSFSPNPATNGPSQHNEFMNSNSKLFDVLYGYNLNELNSSVKTSDENVLTIGDVMKSATVGYSMEFRTILLASLNLDAYVKTINPDRPVKSWNNLFANASVIKNDSDKTLFDYYDDVTQTFVVNSETGERYSFNVNNNQTEWIKVSDTPSAGISNDKKYQSIVFDQLSEKMTALLDKIYAEKGFSDNDKVQIKVPWRYTNMLQAYIDANVGVTRTWNNLDKKGRLVFEYVTNRESDETIKNKLYAFFAGFSTVTPIKFSGWSYDYQSIGSGLDGTTNALNLPILFATIATDNEYKEKLEKSFPNLVKAGLAFIEFVKTQNLSIPYELWPTFSLADGNNLSTYIGQFKFDTDTKEFVELTDEEITEGKFESINTISAKFWLKYQNDASLEELVGLVREIGNTQLVGFDGTGAIATEKFVKTIVNPYYVLPAADGAMPYWNVKVNV